MNRQKIAKELVKLAKSLTAELTDIQKVQSLFNNEVGQAGVIAAIKQSMRLGKRLGLDDEDVKDALEVVMDNWAEHAERYNPRLAKSLLAEDDKPEKKKKKKEEGEHQ